MNLYFLQDPSGLMNNDTFQGALGAARALVATAKPTCLSIAFGMLAIHVFWMITQAIVFQKGWDVLNPLKIVAFIFFMTFYNELATSILWTTDNISNLFEAKAQVLAALSKVAAGNLESHDYSLGTPPFSISLPFDNFSSFLAWLMNVIQEGLSLLIRLLIGKMQVMLVAFMYIAGLFAAMLSTVPGFGGSFAYWLKNLITIMFWSLTLAILDNFMVFFFQSYNPDVANATIDIVVLNLAIIIMYISIPLLTSMFIGHSAASGIMGKMSGVVGGAVGAAAGFAAKPLNDKASIGYKNMLSGIKNKISTNSAKRS